MSVLEIMASLSTDGKWLSWLKYQFLNICVKKQKGQKNAFENLEMMITLDEFTSNFEFKEAFLAHRLFNYLDETKSGTDYNSFIDSHYFDRALFVKFILNKVT